MNERKEVNDKYSQVMSTTRSQMGLLGRMWSHIIHFPPIEGLLRLLDNTILRPVPLLSSGLLALFGGLGVYLISLYNGYTVSTSITPLLAIGGLFIGIVIDYFRIFFGGAE